MPENRNPLLYLDDILESWQKIQSYLKQSSEDDFTDDSLVLDAVVRNLEIIGESAGNIPESFRDEEPEIEWKKIKDLRNILAHEYFGVDVEIIKDLVDSKIPELEMKVAQLRERLEE